MSEFKDDRGVPRDDLLTAELMPPSSRLTLTRRYSEGDFKEMRRPREVDEEELSFVRVSGDAFVDDSTGEVLDAGAPDFSSVQE
jgi:hypothetical protein